MVFHTPLHWNTNEVLTKIMYIIHQQNLQSTHARTSAVGHVAQTQVLPVDVQLHEVAGGQHQLED